MKTVWLLEPQILTGQAVTRVLKESCRVERIKDLAGLCTRLRLSRPDGVLLTHRPPEVDVFSSLHQLLDLAEPNRLIILAYGLSSVSLQVAIESGVGGLLNTTATPDQLRWAVSSVLAGGRYIQPEAVQRALAEVSLAPHLEPDLLSPREVAVLKAAAQGCPNAEIASGMNVSLSTVKAHLRSVFQKLGVKDRTNACARALELGILTESEAGG